MNTSTLPPADPFLRGSFETFPLDHVFGVLALSRQLVNVRFSDAEREVGAVTVKAGHVLGAEDFRTPASGPTALTTLIRDPGMTFSVAKLPADQVEMRNAVAIGTLAELFPQTDDNHVQGVRAPAPAREGPEADAATGRQRKASEVQVTSASSGREPASGGDGYAAKSSLSEQVAEKPVDVSTPDTVADGYESHSPTAVTAPQTALAAGHAADTRGVPSVAKATNEVILRGTLEEIRLEELLEVLKLNPAPLHISFTRDGNVIGTLDLMSQQITKAAAGLLSGREAFVRLYANPGDAFQVWNAEGTGTANTLGSLSDLLAEARETGLAPAVTPTAPQSERSLFMEGRLADFSLEFLIASLDRSQQPIELELRGDGEFLHRVQVKSGRIVSAESAGSGSGNPALAAIRRNPGTEFIIYRCRQFEDGATIAPLRALFSESDPVSAPAQREVRADGRPVDAPARPARKTAESGDDHLSGIESRLDGLTANITELRLALEAEKQAPREAPQVPQALSELVSATANFVSVLDRTHEEALQRALRPHHRGMLRTIVVLQFLCLAVIGCLATLVAL